MAIPGIEQNYNFLNLTGGARGVGAVGPHRPYEGGGVTATGAEPAPSRAVDNLPKAQMVAYHENIPAQAGYAAGISEKTLWA